MHPCCLLLAQVVFCSHIIPFHPLASSHHCDSLNAYLESNLPAVLISTPPPLSSYLKFLRIHDSNGHGLCPEIISDLVLDGWRRTAIYLIILITALSILVIVSLFSSLYLIDGSEPLSGETLLYRGRCDKTSRINLWIHFTINMVSTGILGSSNFFMQILVAPTRLEVDRAHASGNWVEIGVQSIRNFRSISRRKIFLWTLLSLSSIPLHLVFNGCVIETKASTGFKVIRVAEAFLDGAPYRLPPVTSEDAMDSRYLESPRPNNTIRNIQLSVSQSNAGVWEEIDSQAYERLYNDLDIVMMYRRHVILVVKNETRKAGWTRKDVAKNATDFQDAELNNTLWWEGSFQRTGTGQYTRNKDPTGNELIPSYGAELRLSERFAAPCQLRISNTLLLVVCIMCVLKCLLCIFAVTVGIRRDEIPLMTPGDAIASFITTPDSETLGLCTLGLQDLVQNGTDWQNSLRSARQGLEGPRRWYAIPKKSETKLKHTKIYFRF